MHAATGRYLGALLLVVSVSAVAGSADIMVRGEVIDPTGAVIPGARIACPGSQPAMSDARGTFEIRCHAAEDFFQVSAPGFHTERVAVGSNAVRVILRPQEMKESVTVTGSLFELPITESAQSITQLSGEEIRAVAQPTLDDVLRNVAGFTLFRRSGSRVANPTSQGTSLRGLGASGGSRALVLFDGIPLNDPFGGWVYWSRLDPESVSKVEVLQGGGSDIYGSDALAGVVNVFRREGGQYLTFRSEGGNLGSFLDSFHAATKTGPIDLSGFFHLRGTDGYILVPRPQRGTVDTPANSRDSSGEIRLEKDSAFGHAFVKGSGFGERRHNGSPLQSNRTSLFQLSAGTGTQIVDGSIIVRVDGSGQSYHQSFSSIAANRTSETTARLQAVPAQQIGARAVWLRNMRAHSLSLGGDVRTIRGVTEETIFVNGVPSIAANAGGRQLFGGAFLQDTWRVTSKFAVTAGGRLDSWRNHDASSRSVPLASPANVTLSVFGERTEAVFDPRLSFVVHAAQPITVFATAYRSFRAPRLNELYRSFRLGSVLTLANSSLQAERLTGVDTGIGAEWERFRGRATFFFARVDDPIANVTLTSTPALITRQRQNAGRLESRGVEVSSAWTVMKGISLRGDYQFADSRIVSFVQNPQLAGRRTPQVPRHAFSSRLLLDRGSWTASLQGRVSGSQFEDDLNAFDLGGAASLDAFLAKRWTRHFETYFSAENILDSADLIGRTPVATVGLPFSFRGGIKITVGREVVQ